MTDMFWEEIRVPILIGIQCTDVHILTCTELGTIHKH